AADPDRPLSALPLLPDDERQCILTIWNQAGPVDPGMLPGVSPGRPPSIPPWQEGTQGTRGEVLSGPPPYQGGVGGGSGTQYPSLSEQPPIHRACEAQAPRTPGAIALACDDLALSYAALDAQANRLARRLVALGAGPEALVGLCTGRAPAMIVGIL